MGQYSRQEIEDAFQHFQEAADRSAKSGDWREWSECFTEDATYYEHHYGKMEGRQAIYEWIQQTHDRAADRGHAQLPDRLVRHRRGARLGALLGVERDGRPRRRLAAP